jgi:L-iditol 2-dehydrogenase
MRGAYFLGDEKIVLMDIRKPEPGPGQVLLAMKASGICGSDFRVYRRPSGEVDPDHLRVGGHEPCGEVAEVGTGVTNVKVGDRVMMHHYSGCRRCAMCEIGYTQMCFEGRETYGFSMDGGHQDFLLVPDYTCVKMPDALPFEAGAAIACGTGTAHHAVKRLAPQSGETVAVFGQGPVGLSATMFAASMGARVIAVDMLDSRLVLAKALGAAETINAATNDVVSVVKEAAGSDGPNATLDATGIPAVRLQAVDAARVWGRVCFVGEGNTTTFDISEQIIHRQLTVYGSWTFSLGGLAETAGYVVRNALPMDKLITHRFPLDEIDEAYRTFASGESGKVVVEI